MQLPLYIAKRYLFSKKSTNAINIITAIATLGITVGTAALLLILCVFNGFEDLISNMMNNFNPDIKITPAKGKTFAIDSNQLAQIRQIGGVQALSVSLEEVAFFEYAGGQDFGIIKGVDKEYKTVTSLGTAISEGQYATEDANNYYAIVGAGLRNKLSINVENPLEQLSIFMAKKEETGAMEAQFRQQVAMPIGTFSIQQDFDNQYIITSIDLVQKLLAQNNQISAIEVKLHKSDDTNTRIAIKNIMGQDFVVKDRYQQNEAFMKIMNVEKWLSFAIVCLTLILVAFNMIGSLWMIVLDKKKDISILKSMGLNDLQVRNIFLSTGFWLVAIGLVFGLALALLLYAYHKAFGLVPVPPGFVMETYPASIRWYDFITVSVTVISIGLIASIPSALKAKNIPALVRD